MLDIACCLKYIEYVGFEVSIAVTMKNAVFKDVGAVCVYYKVTFQGNVSPQSLGWKK
jgi:hypothetical protein